MIRLTRRGLTSSPALSRATEKLSSLPDGAAADYANASTASSAWGSMRPDLVSAQHGKCGWCESFLERRAVEVDHIRPKSRQQYWWLAFNVDNLLAACRSCNNVKSNRWPLVTGAQRLLPRQSPLEFFEQALVVDPTSEDPDLDLTFDFVDGQWRIAGRSDRGRETITVLELDRTTLTDKMNYHAQHVLDPLVRAMQDARTNENHQGFTAAGHTLAVYRSASHPWSALSRHVFQEALAGRYRP